jgi:purine-nucleoside phosphorylase
MKTVVLPVNVMRCLCVKVVVLTNAAGGLNPDYNVGDVVCVSDHFAIPQLAGKNSLVGPNDDELGPRFPATSNAYNDELRAAALKAAKELNLNFVKPHGTYCFVSGPMYESKAECRFLRMLGGDTVGMSTVPEAVTAQHCNMQGTQFAD